MSRSHARNAIILAGILALGLSGCEGRTDDLPREAVSGSVKLDGQPLAKGIIQFAPTSDKVTTTARGEIIDGNYSISRAEGLVPGTYKVAISAFDNVEGAKALHGAPGKVGPPPKNIVPKQYNTASKLTAEIKGGQDNTFPFEIAKDEVKSKK
jgi:hypothetical protein